MSEFAGELTIYNRYLEDGQERWQRKLLEGVLLLDRRGEAVRHGGAASSSARRIGPVSVGELKAIIPMEGREDYLPPWEWQRSDSRNSCWTLRPGDILLPGNCAAEITDTPSCLLDYCGRVMVISTVTAMEQEELLRHWEVTAR